MRFLSKFCAGAAGALLFGIGLSEVAAEPREKPRLRSFRPIVPIKQNVRSGTSEAKTRTISVAIPPPPIPGPESSLFPEASLPDPDFPEEFRVGSESDEGDSTNGETVEETAPPASKTDASEGASLTRLRKEAHELAAKGLRYKFGADDPTQGGMDCSGTMQYLLSQIGIEGVPRTSYDQYYWLKKKKMLDDVYGKSPSRKMLKKLAPGDLIFWGGTWKSGHRVSHVMLYMGYNPEEDKHYVFGARGKSTKGLLGNGVDVFELDPDRGRLVAHGKIPGLIYE
ncbi:MAG: NlpC/P60 family protein [Verrucomicrobiales bacterium]